MSKRAFQPWGIVVAGFVCALLTACNRQPPIKLAPPVFNPKESPTKMQVAAKKVLEDSGAHVTWLRNEHDVPAYSVGFPKTVTEAALKALKDLNVERLFFSGIPKGADVTDAQLKELRHIEKLEFLLLEGTGITDAGLKELSMHKNLLWLELSRTFVTDFGLKELKGLKKLRHLGLAWTKITDAGLKELNELTELDDLTLNETQVSDAGLRELKGHTKLRNLLVPDTRVTDAGVQELQAAIPELKIRY